MQVRPQLIRELEELVSWRDGRNLTEEAVQRLRALLDNHAVGAGTSTGVRPKGLFTAHFLFSRLPRTGLWEALKRNEPAEVSADWRLLLEALGYELEVLDEGFLATAAGQAVAVVRAEATEDALDRPLSDLHDLPYRRLAELMSKHRLECGLLVSGSTVPAVCG